MCGFINWFGGGADEARLQSGLAAITHRGPDDSGIHRSPDAWLGFRRLSIQDLSAAGHQPMVFGNGRFVLTFNGEIYNFRELRQKHLENIPHRSSGDTEVLGQMLERMPVGEVLNALRGMFAFVWYDSHLGKVVAARDQFGIKPLYFWADGGRLCAGSELKSLVRIVPGLSLDPDGLRSYLAFGSVSAPDSMLCGVKSLQAGECLEWDQADGPLVRRWNRQQWKPSGQRMKGGMPEWREAVRESVFGSVQAHLVSDVEVGVFLSGGLDSSLLACAMHHLGHPKLKAFSIGYEQDVGVPDESGIAERTARHLGASFEKEVITSAGLFADFDRYILAMDQPTGDALNTYLASRVAAKSVKVAMSGVGVDEWFGGYTYQKAMYLSHRLGLTGSAARKMLPLLQAVCGENALGKTHPAFRKASQLFRILAHPDLVAMHAASRRFFHDDQIGHIGTGRSGPSSLGMEELREMAPDSFRNQLLALDSAGFLRHTLLRDADWSSMAHSLELRTPFVDKAIFELAAALPPEAKLTASGGKRVFRECFTDILPHWILDDRKKKTFTLPKADWMRKPQWRERIGDTLRSQRFDDRGIMGRRIVEKTLDDFYSFRRGRSDFFAVCQKVWLLFVLEEWCRHHIDPA